MAQIVNLYYRLLAALEWLGAPMLLLVRLWMAHVFFVSGLLKISDWGNTIYLFTNEFPVPHMPPLFAAIMGTTFELSCPVLLTLGLFSRLATLPLLTMTAVINFTYDNNIEHSYWAILLGIILCKGPGKLSLDYWLKRRLTAKDKHIVLKEESLITY